jgi:hypothetical protein
MISSTHRYAHVCSRMLTYSHVCSRMLTYMLKEKKHDLVDASVCPRMLTYAHVCSRMLTYAHVCSRMLKEKLEYVDASVLPTFLGGQFAHHYADVC